MWGVGGHIDPITSEELEKTLTRRIIIISLTLVVQIVPITGKTKLVAQVLIANCATCATAQIFSCGTSAQVTRLAPCTCSL